MKKAATQLSLKYYALADMQNERKDQLNAPRHSESAQQQKIREFEHENAKLRRANDILKVFSQKAGRSKDEQEAPVHP